MTSVAQSTRTASVHMKLNMHFIRSSFSRTKFIKYNLMSKYEILAYIDTIVTVAQLVERSTLSPEVQGSNLYGLTF